ncbi:MAG: hypothetical protein IJF83_10675 [Methanobrevibacter sp.]|nr:hypothetical protein [Methanobrevibacter sp.]
MIFNKYLSIAISACLFMFLMLLISIVTLTFFNGGSIHFIGLVFVVIFYFIARMFYNYLRNDEFYKNTKKHSSDRPGEKYWIKGEMDTKKILLIVWIFAILILAAVSIWLYSLNHGLI